MSWPGKLRLSGLGDWLSCRPQQCPGSVMSLQARKLTVARVLTPITRLSQGGFFPHCCPPSMSHWPVAQPIPTVSSPFKLNKCLHSPFAAYLIPTLPCGASSECIDLLSSSGWAAAPASRSQLARCALAHGEQLRDPEGELPCERGPSLTAQCSARSGSISRMKSVTVTIACTLNHGLIKLFSL